MKKQTFLFTLLFIWASSNAQNSFRLFSGYVFEEGTHEALVGVTLLVDNKFVAETDAYGHFSFSVARKQDYELKLSLTGFQILKTQIKEADNQQELLYYLSPISLQEVVINAQKNVLRPNMSVIPVERLKSIPMLLGQPDLIKALAFIPGVNTGTEGTTGLFVRGGTPDQNLILLDGGTVYNASHLFGFQSIFDPAAVKDVKFIKGGFPARYGGRLSSVIDVTMKEGNNQKKYQEFSIGLLSSSFMSEGPIKKSKSSYLLSGRAFYWGLFGLAKLNQSYKKDDSPFNFLYNYDVNMKINHEMKNKDKVFVSFYTGNDRIFTRYKTNSIKIKTDLGWSNKTGCVRYTHTFGKALFSNTFFNYNHYNIGERYQTQIDSINATTIDTKTSSIKELSLKQHFSFAHHNNSLLTAGFELNNPYFLPNSITNREKNKTIDTLLTYKPLESKVLTGSFFIENEFKLTPSIKAILGIRNSNYFTKKQRNSFIEPRLNVNWSGTKSNQMNVSYAFSSQYIHLLSNNLIGLNSDIWVPSSDKVLPQQSHLWTISYLKDWNTQNISSSIEVFYKTLTNQIDYRQGIDFLSNKTTDWQDLIEKNGLGRAYGLEMMLKKEAPKYNGWLSYTLSKSERKFDKINNGNWYPHKYDRLHNLNLTFEHKLKKNWSLSSNFVVQSGARITLPQALIKSNTYIGIGDDHFVQEGQSLGVLSSAEEFYIGRNNEKLPVYHRLDINFVKKYETRKHRKAILTLGIYNAYGKRNPYTVTVSAGSYFFNSNPVEANVGVDYYGTSLFVFIPSISYNLKF